MNAMHVYLDHALPNGEELELCVTLNLDGEVVSVEAREGDLSTGRWVPLPDDLGIDMSELAEQARETANLSARGYP